MNNELIQKFIEDLEKINKYFHQRSIVCYFKNAVPLENLENKETSKKSEKLILDKIYTELEAKGTMDAIDTVNEIHYHLTVPQNEWDKQRLTFLDFEGLIYVMIECNLDIKERLFIINYLIEKNLYVNRNNISILQWEDADDEEDDYYEKAYETEKIEEAIHEYKPIKYLEDILENLSKRKRKQNNIDEKMNLNANLFSQRKVKEHYLEKKDTFDEGDIKIIIKCFSIMGITERLRNPFKILLKQELEKRKRNKEQLNRKNVLKENTRKKMEYDYKSLETEVSEVVDLKNMFPKKPLTLEEKVYYLSLLTRMNVSKQERSLFLRNCEMVLEEVSPLREYVENYNRLKYYEESVGLQKKIAFMEECFKEMLFCSHEDYYFWRQSLEETLKQVEHWIPKNYEYEELEASRLLHK